MMEIFWGDPLILIDPKDGDVTRFCTIEKVHYWLRRKWPVADAAQLAMMLYCGLVEVCIR